MRVFSVSSWSNFGHMVISIALLGFGLSGTALTFIQNRVERAPERWLYVTALLFMPAMVLAHIAAQRIGFNPVLMTTDSRQLWFIAAYYAAYGVPFVIGATFIGVSFIALREQIHKLYFWNMLGSGLGGLALLPLMFILPPEKLYIPLCVACFCAAAAFCWFEEEEDLQLDTLRLGLCLATLGVALGMLTLWGEVRVSPFKSISYARKFPDAKQVAHVVGPMGVLDVFDSSYLHFAPGLSLRASLDLEAMPEHAYMGLYIDGGGPIGIVRELTVQEAAYVNYLPMAVAYSLLDHPKVLLVQLGGGISVSVALQQGARHVEVVESNPQIIRLIRDHPVLRDFNGNLLRDPRVRVHHGEARAFAATTRERFDLVEVSLIDSTGLSQPAGYSVDENYVYTVEGIRDYLHYLEPEGLLSITVWNKLDPPRNVPKLLASLVEALRREGAVDPGQQLFVFHRFLSTATMIVKKSPFTEKEVRKLRQAAARLAFDVPYSPGMPDDDANLEESLRAYWGLYQGEEPPRPASADGQPPQRSPLDMGRFYQGAIQWLLKGRSRELFEGYVFDIRPVTDNRPYFTAYLKPYTLPFFLRRLRDISDEWGYVLLWGTLLQAVLFGLLIVALPMALRWRELFSGRRGTGGVIIYYSCLGLGYMLVEIVLIQKLVLFLAAPIYAVSLVITSMLILSGLGSRFSARFAEQRARGVRWAVGVIVPALAFYAFLVDPFLRVLLPLPLPLKFLTAIILMAPAAFCMGFPFPSGLSALSQSRPALLPWAWGMNGALSVTGAVLTKLLSISFGFPIVLLVAAAIYALAAAVFRANELP
ncbi:MAG: hypothetical protein ACUVX8_03285 [Candidatus Zipacnadales bacterium]